MKYIGLLISIFFSILKMNAQVTVPISIITYGQPTNFQFQNIGYSLNNIPIEYNGCGTDPALIVAVIDSMCNPWNTCEHHAGQLNIWLPASGSCNIGTAGTGTCKQRPEKYFIFRFDNPNEMIAFGHMVSNVPDGNYVLVYTWLSYPYSTKPNFASTMQFIGATDILNLQDSMPYIFLGLKGDTNTYHEMAGSTSSDSLNLNESILCVTSSVPEIENTFIKVWPNPASDRLNILTDLFGNYYLSDLSGKIIRSGTHQNKQSININGIKSGIYILTIQEDNKNYHAKVVIR